MKNKYLKILLLASCALIPFGGLGAKEEIRDIFFEIHNDEIKSAMERKVSMKKFEKFFCEVYWLKDQKEVVVVADELKAGVRAAVRKICERKSDIVIPASFDKYLNPFEKSGVKGDWDIYVDQTGVNSINEVWVKRSPLKEEFIEKRPTGTTKLHYTYQKVKGLKRLKEVKMSSYEGVQNISSKTVIYYAKIDKYLLPVKAEVHTNQNLVKKEMGDFTRNIQETFYFKNYKVNASEALIYFSKR
ncbi:MAG: hypothetical protein WD025_06520 [Bacteriovoracaceae bacterium]